MMILEACTSRQIASPSKLTTNTLFKHQLLNLNSRSVRGTIAVAKAIRRMRTTLSTHKGSRPSRTRTTNPSKSSGSPKTRPQQRPNTTVALNKPSSRLIDPSQQQLPSVAASSVNKIAATTVGARKSLGRTQHKFQ